MSGHWSFLANLTYGVIALVTETTASAGTARLRRSMTGPLTGFVTEPQRHAAGLSGSAETARRRTRACSYSTANPLVLGADLVAVALSRLAAGHHGAAALMAPARRGRSCGRLRGWPTTGRTRGCIPPKIRVARGGRGVHRPPRPPGAGPREHGRQAARSKRDRPGGQAGRTTNSTTFAPPQAARLIH